MAKVLGLDGKGGQQQQTPPPQQKITLDQTEEITCPKCEGDVFFPGVKFRKISKLLTGTPNDQYFPIEVYTCGSCGEILEEMLPKEFK